MCTHNFIGLRQDKCCHTYCLLPNISAIFCPKKNHIWIFWGDLCCFFPHKCDICSTSWEWYIIFMRKYISITNGYNLPSQLCLLWDIMLYCTNEILPHDYEAFSIVINLHLIHQEWLHNWGVPIVRFNVIRLNVTIILNESVSNITYYLI